MMSSVGARPAYASAARRLWDAGGRDFRILTLIDLAQCLLAISAIVAAGSAIGSVVGDSSGARGAKQAFVLAVLALASTAVSQALGAVQGERRLLTTERVTYSIEQELRAAVQSVELIALDEPEFNDQLRRLTSQEYTAISRLSSGASSVITGGWGMGLALVALTIINPLLLALAAISAAGPIMLVRRGRPFFWEAAVQTSVADRKRFYVFGLLSERASAAETRAYQLAPRLYTLHDELWSRRISEMRRAARQQRGWTLLTALSTFVGLCAALGVLATLVDTGRLDASGAVIAGGACLYFGGKISEFTPACQEVREGSVFIADVEDFLTTASANAESHPNAGPASSDGIGRFALDNVCFTYPQSDHFALEGVSLEINQGEIIALVGENGSGKTTLAKLLAGLYAPTAGSVEWFASDGRPLDRHVAREHAAILFQDYQHFYFTLRDNVAYGSRRRMSDAEVMTHLRETGLEEVATRLHGGLDGQLGPHFGGADLSGGQWQRLAVARALARDASVLVLDEPSAALDARAEYELFRSVRERFAGKTVIIVSHRFVTTQDADRIYVMASGRIVESGSHGDLVERDGLYAKLYEMSARTFNDLESVRAGGPEHTTEV
jgi:ATP-binding cassette subfamily B protein